MKTETSRMLRILLFEALLITAGLYAAVSLVTRHYSKPYWVSQVAAVAALVALPANAYKDGKIQ